MSPENGSQIQAEYRRLPSVEALLRVSEVSYLTGAYGVMQVTEALRTLLQSARQKIREGQSAPAPTSWPHLLQAHLTQLSQPLLRPVINATGVIIHTNLGRAPLSVAARQAVTDVTLGYSNLEYDLDAGKRGSRYSHARELLVELTGAEDALVVNNCASALFLTLRALCEGREVVVSRGQLVEIGGGFRIPDVLRQSGATLVEVGTTNRTHPRDFAEAISENTAALMRIHSSNFRLIGFVTEPGLDQLVDVALQAVLSDAASHCEGNLEPRERSLVIDDLGSGTLLDTQPYGLLAEPMVQQSVAAGADVVVFSGDKLLGGPQAGILVGKADCIAELRQHPLARALRVDKMTLAALEATLRSYRSGRALQEIPVWRMISGTVEQMKNMVTDWQTQLGVCGIESSQWEGESAVGGGSLPGETLPTSLLSLPVSAFGKNSDDVATDLRSLDFPIICRIQRNHLLFDPRTVLPEQHDKLVQGILGIADGG
ncbi:MAG: L-seryl-tRNA(Sec) selenium transferase [Chloroflexota bacterium]